MAIVYKHTRLDKNEIFYIGIGKTEKRAYSLLNRNKHWYNIVSKTEYKIDILHENLSWEEACKKEIELIAFYGRKHSDAIKTQISNSKMGHIVSDETKRKISERLIKQLIKNKI